jgi:hypothetical protein
VITSHVSGTTLPGTTISFKGQHKIGDKRHHLEVGTSLGASDIFSKYLGRGHRATITDLPAGTTIYVRYWTLFAQGWEFTDQAYLTP